MRTLFFRKLTWQLLLLLGFQLFFSCDKDDPEAEPDLILGLWTFESQELEFYLNGTKQSESEVELYTSILGVDLESFEIPAGSTFEFKEDGSFEGNAEGFNTQTGQWLLTDDATSNKTILNLSSDGDLLFLDIESLPELANDVFFEEDGSIAFEVLALAQTEAKFFLSGETDVEVAPFGTQKVRVDLTINLVK